MQRPGQVSPQDTRVCPLTALLDPWLDPCVAIRFSSHPFVSQHSEQFGATADAALGSLCLVDTKRNETK